MRNYFIKFIDFTTVVVIAVNLLATSGDITMTWTSPILSKLNSTDPDVNPLSQPITEIQNSMITSLINVGAVFGGIPFGYVSENYGRKMALLGIGIFHIVAYLSMAFAKHVWLFYFGRIIGGLAVGGGYTLLPMYIAEVAEESKRGFFSVTLGIFWAFGNFFPYLVGPFVSIRTFNILNSCFPIAFFSIFSLLGTETPYYLVGANKIEQAEKVLMVLRRKDKKDVQEELQHIRDTLEKEQTTSTGDFKIIFTNRGIRKAFIISITLIVLQQLSGWNAITSYLQPIFEAAGTNLSPEICSLVVGAAIFIFSLPAPYFTDKFGRKSLLIFSCGVLGLCLVFLAVFFLIQTRTEASTSAISWLPITSLIILVFAFEIGLAALPWTISAEIFPKHVKKLSSSATSASCWITGFLTTQFFNQMFSGLGPDGTFFLFAAFSFANGLFTLFYVPETRGKTFAEIQEILQK